MESIKRDIFYVQQLLQLSFLRAAHLAGNGHRAGRQHSPISPSTPTLWERISALCLQWGFGEGSADGTEHPELSKWSIFLIALGLLQHSHLSFFNLKNVQFPGTAPKLETI